MRLVVPLLLVLIGFPGPNGKTFYISPDQVVAVGEQVGGACPTAIITLNGTFYVCDTPENVKLKLETNP